MDDQTSFVATIPSCILLDSRLSYGARLLFINISGLTRQRGYCWAENRTLAEKMGVDGESVSPRSITRWLAELVASGDICVETKRDHHGTDRRIWITSGRREIQNIRQSDGYQWDNQVTDGQQNLGGVTDVARGVDSGGASLKEETLNKKSEKERNAPNGATRRSVKKPKEWTPEALEVITHVNSVTGRDYEQPTDEIEKRIAKLGGGAAAVDKCKRFVTWLWDEAGKKRDAAEQRKWVNNVTPFREPTWDRDFPTMTAKPVAQKVNYDTGWMS